MLILKLKQRQESFLMKMLINNAFARMTITTELNHSAIMEFAKTVNEEDL